MYNEEVQEEAAKLMKANGLDMGRMLEVVDAVVPNAIIETDEDGPFWYGDLDIAVDAGRLRTVASILGKSLKISTEQTGMVIPAN